MASGSGGLTIIDTHPIQYQAPLFRAIQSQFGIPVTVIYGSDFSVAGYRDLEFGETFAWDTDLLSGYRSVFLSRVSDGGADRVDRLTTQGLKMAILQSNPRAVLVCGYKPHFHRAAFFYAWRAGFPVFFRGDADHLKKRGLLESWIRDRALRWFYDRCSKLLYVGELPRRHFKRLGVPDEKLVFSPRCVDAGGFRCGELDRERLRRSVRSEWGLAESNKALLFSGKLVPRKGPDLLLQAVKRLPEKVRQEVVVFFWAAESSGAFWRSRPKRYPR